MLRPGRGVGSYGAGVKCHRDEPEHDHSPRTMGSSVRRAARRMRAAGGEVREQVFDVVWSDGLAVDPVTHRCPDNGARVNLDDCSLHNAAGAAALKTRWRDPEFDATERAFYDPPAGAVLPEVADQVAAQYPATTDAQAMQSWADLFTDLTFTYQMRAWARSMQPLASDAWLYWFTWPPPVPEAEQYGAFHGASQMYLFGDLEGYNAKPTEVDRQFASALADTWVRFARTGNPNGGNVPEWPAFTSENEAYMELGPTIRAGNHLRIPQMELVARAWAERRAANAGGRD